MNLPVWRCAAILIVLCAVTLSAQQERVNLGSGINSQFSELQPVVTSDGQILFFTRKGHPDNVGIATRADDEDIWYAVRRSDGSWSDAIHLDGPLNTTGYDGVRAVNRDVTRLYLQNQYRPDGTRGKGYSLSERDSDGSWKFPVPLNIENYYNDTTVATMAMSNDEKVMLLSLKRKDSEGGHDIYVSFRTGNYEFSEPQRIDALSTEGDEIAPFIGFDDCTIYLPTTGLGAENGTHDLFMMHRLDGTWMNWSEPTRLPDPVNTPSADFYFNLTADADTVYLSSWHESSTRGFGKSDIWKVGLPKKYRPGTFLASGEPINPSANGPATGSLLRLDNLYFDVSKSSIKMESHEILADLLALLKRHPTMRIEIQGHTDSDGSEQDNLTLSNGRANAVMKYLIKEGIPSRRLTSVGFGEAIPIAPNTNAEGKRLNRRVMIRILGYDYQP